MKYPNAWQAEGQSVYVSSSKDSGKERIYTISVRVHRPGTPDHGRRIYARLNSADLKRVFNEMSYQMSLTESEVLGEMQGSRETAAR